MELNRVSTRLWNEMGQINSYTNPTERNSFIQRIAEDIRAEYLAPDKRATANQMTFTVLVMELGNLGDSATAGRLLEEMFPSNDSAPVASTSTATPQPRRQRSSKKTETKPSKYFLWSNCPSMTAGEKIVEVAKLLSGLTKQFRATPTDPIHQEIFGTLRSGILPNLTPSLLLLPIERIHELVPIMIREQDSLRQRIARILFQALVLEDGADDDERPNESVRDILERPPQPQGAASLHPLVTSPSDRWWKGLLKDIAKQERESNAVEAILGLLANMKTAVAIRSQSPGVIQLPREVLQGSATQLINVWKNEMNLQDDSPATVTAFLEWIGKNEDYNSFSWSTHRLIYTLEEANLPEAAAEVRQWLESRMSSEHKGLYS